MRNTDHDLARLAARVGRHLLEGGRGVATAESCTGGWIAKAMTDIPGSSQWFVEGFVTYSNESKVRRLGVPVAGLGNPRRANQNAARAEGPPAPCPAGAPMGGGGGGSHPG